MCHVSLAFPRCQVSRLRFIPVVERIVEGEHSLLHRYGGYRKVTGAYVSCALRLKEIDEVMETQDGKQNLFMAFNRCRKLRNLATLFRFAQHPEWVRIVSKPAEEQSGLQKAANAILYGSDPASLYIDLTGPKDQYSRQKKTDEKQRAKLLQQLNPRRQLTHDSVVNHAFMQHLAGQLIPGNFYSLPLEYSKQQSAIRSLDEAQQLPLASEDANAKPCLAAAEADLCVRLDDDALEAVRSAASTGTDIAEEHVFFRVLSSRAGSLRTVRGSVAGRQRLRRGDITITFHKAVRCGDAGGWVLQSQPNKCSQSGALIHVLSGIGASLGDVSQMLCWERSEERVLTLPDVTSSDGTSAVLQKLIDEGSIEGKDSPLPRSLLDNSLHVQAVELREKGWLLETDSGWSLSYKALQHMFVGQIVRESFSLGRPVEGLPLEEFSVFQLCKYLDSQGWTWQRLSEKSHPYQKGALKVWYTSGTTVKHEYLLSLAKAEDMFREQDIRIAHGKSVQYYRFLLDGDFALQQHCALVTPTHWLSLIGTVWSPGPVWSCTNVSETPQCSAQ